MIVHKMVLLATAFKQRTAAHARQQKVARSGTTRCLYEHYKVLVRALQGSCTNTTRRLYEHYKVLCTVTTTSLYTRVASKMPVDKLLKPILFNNKARSRP